MGKEGVIERGEGGRGETEGHESKTGTDEPGGNKESGSKSQHLAVAQTRNIAIDGDDNSEGVTAREAKNREGVDNKTEWRQKVIEGY